MAKIKHSITIDEELITWLNSEIETKRFASVSHGIEYALTVVKNMQMQSQTRPNNIRITEKSEDNEIMIESSLSLEAMRQKWWIDKNIGNSIVKTGGIGVINLKNIIQKNPELFETKEECKAWLYNKLKTEPPIIEEPEIITKPHKNPAIDPTDTKTPDFISRRNTIKCPNCGEERLTFPDSTPSRKCTNCGFIKDEKDNTNSQPDQIAPVQDVPPSPPLEVEEDAKEAE